MRYKGNIIRPPSEAGSLILQVTYGCTHNRCTFCPTYLGTRFGVRPEKEVMEDIGWAGEHFPDTRRVFLTDGNALALSTRKLRTILKALQETLPLLQRVGIYANAGDILRKSQDDLVELRESRLHIVYMGLESGSDKVLEMVKKGYTAGLMVDAVQKLKKAGIRTSVIGLLGLGGQDLSEEHAVLTGKVAASMSPTYFSLLTLIVVLGTELYSEMEQGRFLIPDPMGLVAEQRIFLESTDGIERTIFRSNHASNYIPLAGVLPRDREKLIADIKKGEEMGPSALRPEFLRGL